MTNSWSFWVLILTGILFGFQALLALGQEAAVSPVQHGLHLVLRIIRFTQRKRLLGTYASHLQKKKKNQLYKREIPT